ncbi:hypothetical protein BpHYR1_016038 [Brachionus plicatilis]|uniref:RNA-directed DNA polymerase from mobile element jockey-like n=1 Tax=Brachionus plicatilis TaxID=10195 RepID=A0A3M7R3U1_BRAPC|nr:hypothetical protein BpHYR1_016038 [Brachionus plicatilis]
MKISFEKSCSVVFSRYKKESDNLNLKIYGNRIVSQKEIKFLLNFNILVDEIKERCNKRLNIIKILSNKKWVSNRLFELSERYVGTGLSHSIPLVERLVKEYKEDFESRHIEYPTPLSFSSFDSNFLCHTS